MESAPSSAFSKLAMSFWLAVTMTAPVGKIQKWTMLNQNTKWDDIELQTGQILKWGQFKC
jgi:hypothetical protein